VILNTLAGMKKQKLIADFDYNFKLFGITSSVAEHKIAWEINQSLFINLVKKADIKIKFLNNQNLIISNFLFEREESNLRLLKNKAVDVESGNPLYLLPEVKQFDYIIIITGFEQTFEPEKVISKLNKIDVIQYIINLDVDKLKSKENLVF